ncbi:hypothetical protein Pcinc_031133, partial [Petrolisthes cinctipes]
GSSLSDGSVHEETRQASHNIVHTKDEDIVEYYGVPRGATLAQGVKLGEGMHVVSEDFHEDREGVDLDSLSERFRRARRLGAIKPKPRDAAERTDALTRRPLNFHQEEETRKSETNRWLENHFGSESGRSGSSHNDLEEEGGVQTAGGNLITITMSPRPATPEDVPDAASPSRHWESPSTPTQARGSSKAPPPPPPPKPPHVWTPPTSASPRQTTGPPSEEITDTMIAAARARLRSTGRILDESEQSSPPTSPPANAGSKFTSTPVTSGNFSSPPMSPTGVNRVVDDPVYGSRFRSGSPSALNPTRLFSTPARNSMLGSHSPPDSPPPPLPSTPPPSMSNVGRSQSFNVTNKSWMNDRTKVSTSRPFQSKMKEYRSEEQLDSVGHKTSRLWPPPRREPSPEPAKEPTPPPPPRHRSTYTPSNNFPHYNTAPARSHRSSRTTEIATQTLARDSATQTNHSPVPPPRTKRKNKPKTYYFGQDSSYSPSGRSTRPVSSSTTTVSYTSTSRHNQSSPKIERRFKTTKTITPVIVSSATSTTMDNNSKLKNRSWYYRSMDELSSGVDSTPHPSWTNTIDPRRRPRNYSKEPETQTLPKKLVNGTSNSSPSKTYIFGGGRNSSSRRETTESSTHMRRNHGGSLINVSLAGMSSPKSHYIEDVQEKQTSPKMNRPVIRSHSLNVKPAPLSTLGSPTTTAPYSSGLSSHQRTSSVYRSSPYLNLRSPNLIATIARTNSTRRTDDKENDFQERDESPSTPDRYRHYNTTSRITSHKNTTNQNSPLVNGDAPDDEKRNRFMKGLLTTAPELFHFIHGEDDKKDHDGGTNNKTRQSPPESPPQLIRPPTSPPLTSPSATSPPTSNQPRIFTFGRGETGSNKRLSTHTQNGTSNRLSSLGRQRENLTNNHLDTEKDTHTSITSQRNSLTSQYHRNNSLHTNIGNNSLNRPKFNLKTSGGSVLYSTSFRNRADPSPAPWERRGSDSREHENIVGEKRPGNVTSNLTRDGAVLIPVRDWNSR